MTKQAKVTMKDIAKNLGVSVATVSRALKNNPRISTEKREMIKLLTSIISLPIS